MYSPLTTAPESYVCLPSPPCVCSRSRPTEVAGGHWGRWLAAPCRSDQRCRPPKAQRCLYAHIGTGGSDLQPYTAPAGWGRMWTASEGSPHVKEKRPKQVRRKYRLILNTRLNYDYVVNVLWTGTGWRPFWSFFFYFFLHTTKKTNENKKVAINTWHTVFQHNFTHVLYFIAFWVQKYCHIK